MAAHAATADHGHDDHEHHHEQTFITKYIFSTDHKMISKQYLITGLIMGIIGIAMSYYTRYHHGILCTYSRSEWYF